MSLTTPNSRALRHSDKNTPTLRQSQCHHTLRRRPYVIGRRSRCGVAVEIGLNANLKKSRSDLPTHVHQPSAMPVLLTRSAMPPLVIDAENHENHPEDLEPRIPKP